MRIQKSCREFKTTQKLNNISVSICIKMKNQTTNNEDLQP